MRSPYALTRLQLATALMRQRHIGVYKCVRLEAKVHWLDSMIHSLLVLS
ncbi:hypothetical protein A359_02200 [secondary endosymbiont of Ctenarytaina eucalypti]|uniref:Uncharacterized protein n=1 Tax=secondary endosymbiont of Ctenarytaina eucalypti TaxID=1199245 RepID=J3VRM5_9ENTR|nr:hypothetical protein A359_02200 [secondary endosymbiont of Ctenarytaina eucalypti]